MQDTTRVRRILEQCFEAIEADREPDLPALCGGNAELTARIATLLERERRCAASFTEPPAVPLVRQMPQRVGDFVVLEPLGAGGMSHVYRARQEPLGRDVALKILRDEVVASPTGRLRFQREATITAALDHPNIVPVYAAGEADGFVFLAMKLLRGQPLDRCPPMGFAQLAALGAEVASALQAAHDIGVVHRDVKPQNILVEKGTAFVVDFGLSSFAHGSGVLTRPDSTPGTLLYLAPELAGRRAHGRDPRVDVYGLGATLYERIAGEPAFAGDNPIRTLHLILHQEPAPLRLHGRDRDLETIVLRAMAKNPAHRFVTAGEMAEELRRYADGLPIRSRRTPLVARLWRRARRRPLPSVLAVAVVALAIVLAIALATERAARRAREQTAEDRILAALDQGSIEVATAEWQRFPFAEATHAAALGQAIATGRDLQMLVALLQLPPDLQEPHLRATLVAQLGASAPRPAVAALADVALAVASRVASDDPLTHRPLAATTRAALPRTAAALAALGKGQDLGTILADQPSPSHTDDHLFAALVLRLGDRPAAEIEAELRRPLAGNQGADAIRYSLALALEAQNRIQEAYDLCAQIAVREIYGPLGNIDCARYAAHLGRATLARQHLAAGLQAAAQTAALRPLTELRELDARVALDDRDTFLARWQDLAASQGHLPHYWLRGGYAWCQDESLPIADEVAAAARRCFARGLELQPDAPRRAALEVALLQVDWMSSAACVDFEYDATDEERDRLLHLAKRGESLAATASRNVEAEVKSDALLVAALARRAAGDGRRSWWLLEQATRAADDPAALTEYALLVGNRIARLHLEGSDPEADVGPDLTEAAARGLLRALAAIDRIGSQTPRTEDLVAARSGAMLCAAHLGDAAVALPLAHSLREAGVEETVSAMAERLAADGGLDLAWELSPGHPPAQLADHLGNAIGALRQAHADGTLTSAAVATTIDRWFAAPALARSLAQASGPWPAMREAIAALRDAAKGGR